MSCNLPTLWTDEEWLTKNPERISGAEVSVTNYLKKSLNLYEGKKILHIGIGNSSLFKQLRGVFGQIDGVTNTKQELRVGKEAGFENIYLMNKYSEEFEKLGTYDVIVDVNLKSFACCNEHWLSYFKTVIGKLKLGGRLISHTAGFGGYMSPLTTFDNSMKMEELYKLLENCFLFEMKHLDENGYPIIIEKV